MSPPAQTEVRAARTSPAWRAATAVLLLSLALVAGGCGSSKSSSSSSAPSGASGASSSKSVSAPKTKFVIHAGLAFGAFHRYIYKPVKAGDLHNLRQHKAALIKGAIAAGFVYHELGLALKDAQSSPTLRKVVAPVTALQARMHSLGPQLRNGTASPSAVNQDNSSISSIKGQSSSAGQPVTEQAPHI